MIYQSRTDENLFGQTIHSELIHDQMKSTLECRIHRSIEYRKIYFLLTFFFTFLTAILQVQQKNTTYFLLASFLLTVFLLVKLLFNVKRESLLFNNQIGLQLTTTFLIGRTTTKFIHIDQIENLFINEGFYSQRVIYYLTLILRDDDERKVKMFTLFPHLLPRFDFLKFFYQQFSSILHHR